MTRLSLTTLMILACVSTGQAAEKISYQRLLYLGSVIQHRGITVTTLDGKQHHGRQMNVEPDHLRINSEDLPSDQIWRVEISQDGRFFHHVVNGAMIPVAGAELICGLLSDFEHASPGCVIPLTVLGSPSWAYTAVTAPFFLAADGVAFVIPTKVYEIIH